MSRNTHTHKCLFQAFRQGREKDNDTPEPNSSQNVLKMKLYTDINQHFNSYKKYFLCFAAFKVEISGCTMTVVI